MPILDRLTQAVEQMRRELPKFVEEEDAPMWECGGTFLEAPGEPSQPQQ